MSDSLAENSKLFFLGFGSMVHYSYMQYIKSLAAISYKM